MNSLEIQNIRTKVNLRESLNISDSFKIVGNIAIHTNAKDLPTFINVVDEVVNTLKRKDIKFVQIGEFSKNTPQLKQLVKEKDLEDYVFFTDKIEQAFSIVNQLDLFLMTSEREGGPTSVLESMLLGTPVVSTSVGVVPEVIKDGENGLVATVKDFKKLAKKLISLIDDSNLQSVFSEKSKIIITNHFTAKVIARKTIAEYKRLITVKCKY